MALRDQPYFPLYADDYLTDEKLNLCSAASQGVFIKILCVMHKQTEYGCVLLKQKDKQNQSKVLDFACKFAKLLPFDQDTIHKALEELLDENVLQMEGDKLFQKRMVKDGNISLVRSQAGKSGGGNPILLKQSPKQRDKQNPVYEYEDVNEDENRNGEEDNAIQKFEHPSKEKVINAFTLAGYPEDEAKKFFGYYNSKDWNDARGNPIAYWSSLIEKWMLETKNFRSKDGTNKKDSPRGTIDFDKYEREREASKPRGHTGVVSDAVPKRIQ